ncbi:hypothetical protein GIB67_025157 [Kingdonia uniflora]|uniref:F-box domain-containing protein n=1 Tax=Kingdonia uniflora TaxID=39325 RepID=A0A7J7N876_9MAGN|nr:hypothetical protein GIB67_025157 [Kingdonia uniflora]
MDKRIVEISHDFISDLPDSLLLQILSLLEMHNVISTCLLSRKWRYLWTSIPCLSFEERDSDANFPNFIDKSLSLHVGEKIQKFSLIFDYRKANEVQVNAWIDFAVTRLVEELDFFDFGTALEDENSVFYKMNSSLYQCQSLEVLSLRCCNLNLPDSICLSSLNRLALEVVELSHDAIKDLTSSCPLLEVLFLIRCNSASDLNIFIENPHVESLSITEAVGYDRESQMTIYAPNILGLEFHWSLTRSSYCIKNVSSVDRVFFGCESFPTTLSRFDSYYRLAKLLKDLSPVSGLTLSSNFIQALSLWGLMVITPVTLKVAYLELRTGFGKYELPGIAHLLRSCVDLEKLVIHIDRIEGTKLNDFNRERGLSYLSHYEFDEREYWKTSDFDFSSCLQKLKVIAICNFYYDPYTLPEDGGDNEELFKGFENEIEFARFLLKNSKMLQKLVIRRTKWSTSLKNSIPDSSFAQVQVHRFDKDLYSTDLVTEPSMNTPISVYPHLTIKLSGYYRIHALQYVLRQKLLAFPRASPNAEITRS